MLRVDTSLTPSAPLLRIRVVHRERVDVEYQEVHAKSTEPSRFLNGIAGLTLIAAGGVGVWKGVTTRDPKTDSIKPEGVGLLVAGAVTALGGGSLIAWAFETKPRTIPDEFAYGHKFRQDEFHENKGVPSALVQVRVDATERTYRTNDNGDVVVDLVSDLNLVSFTAPRRIPFTITAPSARSSRSFVLATAMWTVACVRTSSGRDGQVHESANARSPNIGAYNGNQTYVLRDSSQIDWYGIQYRGQLGWIPRLDATPCWNSPLDSGRSSQSSNLQ